MKKPRNNRQNNAEKRTVANGTGESIGYNPPSTVRRRPSIVLRRVLVHAMPLPRKNGSNSK